MGCCESTFSKGREDHNNNNKTKNQSLISSNGTSNGVVGVVGVTGLTASSNYHNGIDLPPNFSEFTLAELKSATNNFSSEFIVSESGEKTPNVVYKGRLQQQQSNNNNNNNRRWIAINKFSKLAWPDPNQFVYIHQEAVDTINYFMLLSVLDHHHQLLYASVGFGSSGAVGYGLSGIIGYGSSGTVGFGSSVATT
ncbi:hypothetical protein ACFE04_001884 [Oxalis oulophora]